MDKIDYLIIVRVDENDADYKTNQVRWPEKRYEEVKFRLEKISRAIRKCDERYNWPDHVSTERSGKTPESIYEGVLTKDEILWFKYELLPYCELGCHTIESIEVIKIENINKLL